MKRQGPKTAIKAALVMVSREISGNAKGGFYAAGLAAEGYAGGYRDALADVLLLLNKVRPDRRDYWEQPA